MLEWSGQVPLLLATFVLMLLFSGIIFGWTDMQLVMEREGVYCTSNCANHSASGSSSRAYDEVKYNLIVTIGEVRASARVQGGRGEAYRVSNGVEATGPKQAKCTCRCRDGG